MKFKYVKKLASLIGPYPYNPTLIFLFFFALYLSKFSPLVLDEPKGPLRRQLSILILVIACIPGLTFSLSAYFLQRYRFWSKTNLFFYILEIASCQSLIFLMQPPMQALLNLRSKSRIQFAATANLNIYLASLALALIAVALIHRAEGTISNRLNDADELVIRLEADRAELVKSGEELLRQTAQFLHDRVQSDLMVIGMNLKSVTGKSSPEVDEALDRASELLEKIRTSDIKNLVQILAPNFEVGGLSEALNQLNSQYLKIMEVSFDIDAATGELEPKQLLGIFRIVEQALLNSLIHGPAGKATVVVKRSGSKELSLMIEDNGPGVDLETNNFGMGYAVIDSWVSILKGRREIHSSPGNGYKLEVNFSI